MAYDKNKAKKSGATFEQKDYRQELTNKLIESLENAGNWEKPWFSCNELPYNISTGNKYKGINFISLSTAQFPDGAFGTYNHWNELETSRQGAHKELEKLQNEFQDGSLNAIDYLNSKTKVEKIFTDLETKGMVDRDKPIHVTKGEKGNPVFKAVEMNFKEKESSVGSDGDIQEKGGNKIWMQVYAGTVFNSSQISNISLSKVKTYDFEPHAEAEIHLQAMIEKTNLKFENNNKGRAFYSPLEHKVVMPNKDTFVPDAYYDTLMHELGHSTGKALNRDMTGTFGTPKYAFEELVAEISSVYMSAEIGIPHNQSIHENNAAYIKHWLHALKEDKNIIFKAASCAQKSADYQNFVRNEYKLEKGLIKEVAKEPEKVAVVYQKKIPVIKKEKKFSMSI